MHYLLTIKHKAAYGHKDTPFPPEMSSLEVVLESTDGCITGTFFATSFHLGFILRPQFFETHGPGPRLDRAKAVDLMNFR